MADPLTISGALVSCLSLAIEGCKISVDYYESFKGAPQDIVRMREGLQTLTKMLDKLQTSLEDHNIDSDAKAEIERVAQDIIVSIENLQRKLEEVWTDDPAAFVQLPVENKEARVEANGERIPFKRFKERAMKAGGRSKYHAKRIVDRTSYPFRERTIRQLQDIIDKLKADLIIAIQVMSIHTTKETSNGMDAIRRELAQIQRKSSAYHEEKTRDACKLCSDFDKLRSAVKSQGAQNTLENVEIQDKLNAFGANITNFQNVIFCTKEKLLCAVRDLQERAEARTDLLRQDVNGVHKELLVGKAQITADIGSVTNNLVPKIDQIAFEFEHWQEEMTRITNNASGAVKALHDEVKPMTTTLAKLDRYRQVREDESFLEWLSPLTTSFETKQSTTFNLRCKQNRAGNQFLQSAEYQQWKEGPGKALWCLGGPGVGKTVLMSSIVDTLEQGLRPDEALVYIYCEHSEAKQYDPSIYSIKLLASIARQLGSHRGAPSSSFAGLRQRHAKSKGLPTIAECREAIIAAAAPYPKIFLVIDALDECPELSRFEVFDELEYLESKAHILITSRYKYLKLYNPIRDTVVAVRALDADMAEYIRKSTRDFDLFIIDLSEEPLLREKIVTEIVRKAAGMFLLARLHIESLIYKPEIYSLKQALEALPDSLGSTYEEIIKRIEVRDPKLAATTKKLIKWISLAMCPLTVEQLQTALAIEPGDVSLTTQKMPQRLAIFRFCPDLLEVHRGDTLGFVHHSVQEHFSTRFASDQSLIALSCLDYLSSKTSNEGPCQSADSLAFRLRKNPLLEYACLRWGYHARYSNDSDIQKRALEFCRNQPTMFSCIQVARLSWLKLSSLKSTGRKTLASVRVPLQGYDTLSLWMATYYGWYELVLELLDGPTKAKVPRVTGPQDPNNDPFWKAVSGNHPDIVLCFVKHGVDVDTKGPEGLTALHVATKSGNQSFVLELLQLGADVSIRDARGWTAFDVAVEQGNTELISQLLSHSLDTAMVKADLQSGNTALHYASMSSVVNAVTTLLQPKSKVSAIDEGDRIKFGSKKPKYSVLFTRDFQNRDAMIYAMMRIFIQKGAEVNACNRDGQTALHLAAARGKTDMIVYLMGLGAGIHMVDGHGQTALLLATKGGHFEAANLLIEHGAQVSAEDNSKSLLAEVVCGRQQKMIQFLLDRGADVNQRTDQGDVALIRLIRDQKMDKVDIEIVGQLLSAWADPNVEDMNGLTALDYAKALGETQLVELLRRYGAEDGTDNDSNGEEIDVSLNIENEVPSQKNLGFNKRVE